ncbi:MAG: YdbH domain-containing protein, partial [Oceanospirillaceae bacterium]
YYLAHADANPWMTQLPIDLRKLQFLGAVDFDFDPKQWQFKVKSDSKISATQVVSRRKAGTVQLFASDKLNLTNDQTIKLAYLPEQDYWTWSNAFVHLRPELIPSQGLEVNLAEGSTLLSNQPVKGSFELRPTSVNLTDWPSFQVMSTGGFNWLDGQLNINFNSELSPYISALNGKYTWRANTADHQLLVQAKDVALPPLMTQLNQLENSLQLPAPLLANITRGTADYEADWHWSRDNLSANQKFNYSFVDGHSENLKIKGLTGQSQFDYKLNRVQSGQNAEEGVGGGPKTSQFTGTHQIKAEQMNWGPAVGQKLLNPQLSLSTNGWTAVTYQIDKIEAEWLGGSVLGQNLSIQPALLNTLPISLQGINLKELINLAKTPNLDANGEVSGDVNMALDLTSSGNQTWRVSSASLSSSKAGTIQYKTNDDVDLSDKANYLQEILSEFQFQHISAQLTHNKNDKLQLLTRFVGTNDNFEEGKKVDFSLTLNPQFH